MKTLQKVFMYLFLVLGITALEATLSGHSHQWVMAFAGFSMFALLKRDLKNFEKRPKNTPLNNYPRHGT
ncbi:MAG: hypothetical protein LBH91_03165 [Prevotellaceae bacterium]|jgi:hypothetical protein|nr:hypothetical protein [Prevotellaceae bacterium]